MSSSARRAEKRREWEAQQEAHVREQARLEARSWWEKIEDAKDFADVREILHGFADRLGLE